MGRETILESQSPVYEIATGTISITAATKTVVGVGTSFTSYLPGDIIKYEDDTSVVRYGVIDVITDNLNLSFVDNALGTATAQFFRYDRPATPYFVGDNSVTKKPLTWNVNLSQPQLQVNSKKGISRNEGVLIKTIYLRLPYQYTMSSSPVQVQITYRKFSDPSVSYGPVETLAEGGNSGIYIPGENGEIDVNAYAPPPSNIEEGEKYYTLSFNIVNALNSPDGDVDNSDLIPSISQVDAPDSLNGVVLPCYVGLRILHAEQNLAV